MFVARRNGSSVMQMAVVLACIAVVVISAVEFLGNNANTALEETAKDVADPARLAGRFAGNGNQGQSQGTTGSQSGSTGSSSGNTGGSADAGNSGSSGTTAGGSDAGGSEGSTSDGSGSGTNGSSSGGGSGGNHGLCP